MGDTHESPVKQEPGPAPRGKVPTGKVPSGKVNSGKDPVQSTPSGPASETRAPAAEPPAGLGYADVPPHAQSVIGEQLARLDSILDQLDVPEDEVLSILRQLSWDDIKVVVSEPRYRARMLAALTDEEVASAVAIMGVELDVKLSWMLAEGTSYEGVRSAVGDSSPSEQAALLADPNTIAALKKELGWHDFARLVELMGQLAPDVDQLLADPMIQAEIEAAWIRSNPAVRPPPGVPVPAYIHEEAGWIYFNILTGALAVRLKEGAPDDTVLRFPPRVDDSVIVGTFHTHPNLGGITHVLGPNPGDMAQHLAWGVPGILRTEVDGVRAIYTMEPSRRLHLAGSPLVWSWSFPGADGGTAP